MGMEVLIPLAIAMAVEMLIEVVGGLIKRWGRQKLPQNARAELSDTDREEIEVTQELIAECFGEDVVARIKSASNKERIALMTEFADRLAKEYGLDIEVDVTVDNVQSWGAYNWEQRKAVFNIALLMVDGNHEQFDYCVRETLDTIIHELRHAVQHKAINEPGFWNVSDERRVAWADNMVGGNYIPATVDARAYANQPIELDAFTFAAAVMEGVH